MTRMHIPVHPGEELRDYLPDTLWCQKQHNVLG
jgi:hypothetical protein